MSARSDKRTISYKSVIENKWEVLMPFLTDMFSFHPNFEAIEPFGEEHLVQDVGNVSLGSSFSHPPVLT